MYKKIEDTIINTAEKLYEKAEELFRVKNELLFETQKPIEIIQFPVLTKTADTQTHEIAKELIRKLGKHGLSFDTIKKSKLYFQNINDAKQAIEILNTMYPSLAKKTSLHKWEDTMPNPNYKLFIEIKASKNKQSKKANL